MDTEKLAFSSIDNEKLVMEEFIMCYKRNRILWDNKCNKNVTRVEKDKIFNELANILSKIKQDSTVEDVKKKINALRSNYRRELRKVRRSEALAGANKESIFHPTLWWFELMHFLQDVMMIDDHPKRNYMHLEDKQRKRRLLRNEKCQSSNFPNVILPQATAEENYLSQSELVNHSRFNEQLANAQQIVFKQERDDTNQTLLSNDVLQQLDTANDYANNLISTTSTASNGQTPHSTNGYMEEPFNYEAKNFKMSEVNTLATGMTTSTAEYDTHNYIAILWAKKLRRVHPRQRLYAEKAINDIIFEAELGTLTRNSVKINES